MLKTFNLGLTIVTLKYETKGAYDTKDRHELRFPFPPNPQGTSKATQISEA